MRSSDLSRGRAALTLVLLLMARSSPAQPAVGPESAATSAAPIRPTEAKRLLDRWDFGFALVSTAAVVVAGHNDLWLRSEGIESNTRLDRNLANTVRPLGDPALVLPALLAGYGLARAFHAPEMASQITDVGLAVGSAGAGALVLKELVGRARPADSPADSRSFRPFSGRTSFPSGHATVAFALAESVNQTSGNRWAPWISYPAAGLVAWSRVRDDRHWSSDVVAGAALGVWTARKTHRLYPAVSRRLSRVHVSLCTPDGAPGLVFSAR